MMSFIIKAPEASKLLISDLYSAWRYGGLADDAGAVTVMNAVISWLCRAQDSSASADGGVARHFGLRGGWAPSYPETTGYIVPTFLDQAHRRGDAELRQRAARMLDWLCAIQFPEGGFQGGMVTQLPRVPVTFNTGQILLGLAAGTAAFGERYREPMARAADWLVATQDPNGKWSRHPTPFAAPGLKAYETHVAWGLFEAARLQPDHGWGEAALRQVDWAIGRMAGNGWPAHCCLSRPEAPLTHTLGYMLRGILEAWRFGGERRHLDAALRLGTGLRSALRTDGRLPGRLRQDWQPAVAWDCLTGSAQVAHAWLILFEATGDEAWRGAARAANAFVRRTVRIDAAEPGIRGGVAGSYPLGGDYGRLEYLNWAAKFLIDATQKELDLS
jgi:hypothetical protein